MTTPRHIRRFTPCGPYDVSAMEQWLDSMSKQGFRLVGNGFSPWFSKFEVAEPSDTKYRIVADTTPPKGFFGSNKQPSDLFSRQMHRDGWNFVSRVGVFYVYSATADKPDPKSDPNDIAKVMNSEIKFSCIAVAIGLLIYLGVFWFFGASPSGALGGIWQLYDQNGVRFITHLLVNALPWLLFFFNIPYLFMVKKKLTSQTENAPVDLEKSRRKTAINRILRVVSATVLIWLLLFPPQNEAAVMVPIVDYSGEIPFATLTDILPELVSDSSEFERRYEFEKSNTITLSSDIFAPTIIKFYETFVIDTDDDTAEQVEISLFLSYYDTVSPLFAGMLADRKREFMDQVSISYEETAPTAELLAVEGLDRVFLYDGESFVLTKGDVIVTGEAHVINSTATTYEEIVLALAKSL